MCWTSLPTQSKRLLPARGRIGIRCGRQTAGASPLRQKGRPWLLLRQLVHREGSGLRRNRGATHEGFRRKRGSGGVDSGGDFLRRASAHGIAPVRRRSAIARHPARYRRRRNRSAVFRNAGWIAFRLRAWRQRNLSEIFAATADGAAIRLTDGTAAAAGFQFARRELVRWKSTDGTEIEGILYKPADFNPAKKYALLVAIHGGPVALDQPTLRPDRYYPIEQFVARGALVLRPNYRGSAGYGAKFRALPVRNLGIGDAADIVYGVDYLIGKGFIDPDRVGAMGWSEGGYISAFLATTSNRFAAVSVGAGVSDWTAYYVHTDIAPFTPPVPESDAMVGTGSLPGRIAGHLREQGEYPGPDPARRRRSPRASHECLRASAGARRPQGSGAHDRL